MKKLLIFLLFISVLSAQDIDGLLDAYEKASDHSYKTKDESAGNLVIYTRDDLDRMQAYTLKDLLKSLRMHQYVENRMGQSDPFNKDPVLFNSMPMRIYLNDRELISSLFGSGTSWFGDMELDFIDHVEIYQGLPSLDISTEPAQIVVRLYSKTAAHDEGGRIKASGGSYGSNMQNIYYTQNIDDWSYFVYAGRYDDKRDTYALDNEELSRNKRKEHLLGSLTTQHHRFEIHVLNQKSDDFLGPTVAGAPLDSQGKLNYFDLFWQGNFLNDSLTMSATYAKAKNCTLDDYSQALAPGLPFTKIEQGHRDESLTLDLKKEFKLENNTLRMGVQYREKWFEISKLLINDLPYPYTQSFDNQKIYALYLQDHYAVDVNNLVTFSYMYQYYSTKGSDVNDDNTHQIRAGYTYVNDTVVSKSSASYQEYMPEPYMMIKSFYGNPDLKPSNVSSFTQEFNFNFDDLKTGIMFGFAKFDNSVMLVNGEYINSNKTLDLNLQSINFTYDFFENDTLEFMVSRKQKYLKKMENVTTHTALLRMLNSINKYDVFNEIVMYEGYTTGNGVDYSAGIRYHINRDVTLSIKGENLFNSGLSWEYMTQPMPEPEYIEVPTIDRKVTVGLEWLF